MYQFIFDHVLKNLNCRHKFCHMILIIDISFRLKLDKEDLLLKKIHRYILV